MEEKCTKCGSKEIPATTPRTVYACGSSDYDQRPGTFVQRDVCKELVQLRQTINDFASDISNMLDKHIEKKCEGNIALCWFCLYDKKKDN